MHHRCKAVLSLTLLVASVAKLCAQTPAGTDVTLRTLPRRFVQDEWRLWKSPFQPASYRSRTMRTVVLPLAAATVVLIANDNNISTAMPNSRDQEVWSGRVSQIGASYSLAGLAGTTYLVGKLTHNRRAQETGLLGMEAFGHAQVVVFALKQITNRERPPGHDRPAGFWGGGTSFPSGHAAGSFAVATVFAYEYRDHPLVPIAAYSVAGLIAASRVGARRHWMSDIAVGGALGYVLGRITYKRHHDGGSGNAARLIPQVAITGQQVVLTWQP